MARYKMTIWLCKCERCGHKWMPKNQKSEPITCPKCKSPYWNKPRKKK